MGMYVAMIACIHMSWMRLRSDQLKVKSDSFIIGGRVSSVLEAEPWVSLSGAYAAVVVSLGDNPTLL